LTNYKCVTCALAQKGNGVLWLRYCFVYWYYGLYLYSWNVWYEYFYNKWYPL